MVFTPRPLNLPSRQVEYGNLGALAANIGQQFTSGLDAGRKQREDETTRALLGEAMKTGDFNKAGMALLGQGKVEQGTALIGLGRQAASDANDARILQGLGLGGTPSASGVSIPRVQAPKQGVHVAETEDDVQRLERATGMVTTDADRNAIIKTVYGEADSERPEGQQAVAAVIRNRANQSGLTPEQITQQPNQFEPWNTAAGRARMNGIGQDRFNQIAGTVAPVIEQGLDPTGGATHFYAPRAQAALGRSAPSWDDGSGSDLGNHRFFSHGYGQGGGTPAPSAQTIIAQSGGEAPVQTAQAPVGGGGTYAGVPAEVLQGYLNSPRVPENYKTMMREELARRSNQEPVQVAQAPQQPGAPVSDAPNQPAPDASVAGGQGFVIPGTGEVVPVETIANNPRLRNLAAAAAAVKDPAKRAGIEKMFQLELEATKERTAAEGRGLDNQGKRLQNQKLEQELSGDGARPLTEQERQAYGVQPGQAAFMTRRNEPKFGPVGSTVNVGAGEKEEEKAIGGAAGKRAGETMAAAASASKQLLRLGQVEALMKNVETGRLQPNRMSIAALGKSLGVDEKFLEGIGLDPKGVGDAQALNAISGRMLVDMIGSGGFPANNFSNTDREFLTGTLPSLANDPRANSLLVEVAKRTAQIDIEKAKGWREWKRSNQKGSFDDYELEFGDKLGATDRFADLAQKADALTGRQRVAPRGQPAPGATPTAQPPAARPAQPLAPRTATNPNTGERIMLDPATGQWVPYS